MDDPFATMGLEPRFDLDEQDLHRRFIERSAAAHPDRYSDPVEQAEAAQQAAAVNEAYRVLSDPERRANALLARLGGPAKEDDNTLPPDLLVEVMEVREQMEEAIASNDQQELRRLRDWAQNTRTEHLRKIAGLFEQATAEGKPDGKAIRLELNALRYAERMLEQMPDA